MGAQATLDALLKEQAGAVKASLDGTDAAFSEMLAKQTRLVDGERKAVSDQLSKLAQTETEMKKVVKKILIWVWILKLVKMI